MAKPKNSNCDKTKKKLWQDLKDQIVTKLKNSNCRKKKKKNCDNPKTQIVTLLKITVVTEVVLMTPLTKNTLTPWQPTNSQGSFSQLLRCFFYNLSVFWNKKSWCSKKCIFHGFVKKIINHFAEKEEVLVGSTGHLPTNQ